MNNSHKDPLGHVEPKSYEPAEEYHEPMPLWAVFLWVAYWVVIISVILHNR